VRVSQTEITAVALDTAELAGRHWRRFARHLTFTDPAISTRWISCGASAASAATSTSNCARWRATAADPGRSKTSELAHLFRALKAPAGARALPKLAERAREEQWSYERFAEALAIHRGSSRESHGGESGIKAARYPARKTLEKFDFTFQRSVRRHVVEHFGQLDLLRREQ